MDSSGVMGHSGDGNPEYIAERTAVSAIAGGTASVLSGGKFANGAITGAFAQLYNADGLGKKVAVAGGQVIGGLGGFAIGVSATGGCAALTYGGCTPLGASIVGASSATGYTIGGNLAGVIYDAIESIFGYEAVYRDPPADAYDPQGAKAPGKPSEVEGFKDPKGGDNWVDNPNGKGCGWEDCKGDVWVPTGQGSKAHGGPHWDVQHPDGTHTNVYPGGHRR